jgi:arylsulfatase
VSGFGGSIGRTVQESTPWWPAARHAEGPNVVVILLDDVGFAQLGCYGSSIATPHMDRLATGGLRYTNFHVTALCSPTRASLMTGRNHHAVGVGFLAAFDTGFPNYRGEVTPHAATVAETLREAGYGTYMCGKWHLTPPTHMTAAGPFHQWPTGRGFDRYYGFLWGEDDQYRPELWHDQHRVDPPRSVAEGYHLSADLVDQSERFLADHLSARPDDPFFLYLAFGACHAPHQAPREYVDAYRGAFDHGWDEERRRVLERQRETGIVPAQTDLAPRNPGVAAWEDIDPDRQRLYARMQEVFAGFMTHTDEQIGRLVAFLERHGVLDDTLILLMSDNGASGEGGEHGTANEYRWFLQLPDPLEDTLAAYDELGGPAVHNHYPTGWAQAGNTPLKYYKRYAYAGGVRAPLIAHWPARLGQDGGLRRQFHHVVDVVPTILDVCGVTPPAIYRGVEQMPMHGTSMAYSLDDAHAPGTRSVQYFETAGHRGVCADGWKAVAAHVPGTSFDEDRWELYRLAEDVSECHDLAARHPERVAALQELWWAEAERYGVLPLDDRMQVRMAAADPATDRTHYVLLPGSRLMSHMASPGFSAREFSIRAEVGGLAATDEGVLLAWGRQPAGISLFVQDGRLWFDYNLAGDHVLVGSEVLAPTVGTLGATVERRSDGAVARLWADGVLAGEAALPRLLPGGMGTMSTQCGHNAPSPVSARYESPYSFTGDLHRVVIDLGPRDPAAGADDWRAELAQQ